MISDLTQYVMSTILASFEETQYIRNEAPFFIKRKLITFRKCKLTKKRYLDLH